MHCSASGSGVPWSVRTSLCWCEPTGRQATSCAMLAWVLGWAGPAGAPASPPAAAVSRVIPAAPAEKPLVTGVRLPVAPPPPGLLPLLLPLLLRVQAPTPVLVLVELSLLRPEMARGFAPSVVAPIVGTARRCSPEQVASPPAPPCSGCGGRGGEGRG